VGTWDFVGRCGDGGQVGPGDGEDGVDSVWAEQRVLVPGPVAEEGVREVGGGARSVHLDEAVRGACEPGGAETDAVGEQGAR